MIRVLPKVDLERGFLGFEVVLAILGRLELGSAVDDQVRDFVEGAVGFLGVRYVDVYVDVALRHVLARPKLALEFSRFFGFFVS